MEHRYEKLFSFSRSLGCCSEQLAPVGVDTKEWIKKDAAALHAIRISCGPNKFDVIEEINSAKNAWDTLKKEHIDPSHDFIDSWERRGFQTMERPQSLILQNAIDNGHVNVVMDFLKRNPGAEKLGLWTGKTSLHYATDVGKSNIVEALLESTTAVLKDLWDDTALRDAALFGNTEIAKYLVRKDSSLLSMEDSSRQIPLVTACRAGHKEVTNFLYSETPFEILLPKNGKQGSKLLRWCLISQRFDIMFDVLHRGQSLIDENWKELLNRFARSPTAFSSGIWLTFWQRWIYECLKVHIPSNFVVVTTNQEGKKFEEIPLPGRLWRLAAFLLPFLGIRQIHALKLSHRFAHASLCLICQQLTKLHLRKYEDTIALRKVLTSAIENGNYDVLIEMVKTNVDLLSAPVPNDETTSRNFLMDAIEFRQEKIVRFLVALPHGRVFINLLDSQQSTILHMAGKLAPASHRSRNSSAAVQMQREIQWFEEVGSLLSQYQKDHKNKNGENAYQVFVRDHKDLLKQAEDWMKRLVDSYITIEGIIITILLADAFTLPGGSDQSRGFPINKNKAAFTMYVIANAVSLFAATTSAVIFLGFLTSRYSMVDFHKSIPKKLLVGFSTFFVSLAAVMIAFCSAIFLMLENQWWIIIPSVLLAGIPVTLFTWMQFPLLVEIYVLIYRSPIFSEKRSLASKIKAFFFGKKKID